MKSTRIALWALCAVFLLSAAPAHAQWGTKTWRNVRGTWGLVDDDLQQPDLQIVRGGRPGQRGSLTIRTGQDGRGGSGSLDLYVRYGRLPDQRQLHPAAHRLGIPQNDHDQQPPRRPILHPRPGAHQLPGFDSGQGSTQNCSPHGANSRRDERGDQSPADGTSYTDYFYPETYTLTVSSFYMDKHEVTKAQWDEVYNWAIANGYDLTTAVRAKLRPIPSIPSTGTTW
jgi:hypothetical protein